MPSLQALNLRCEHLIEPQSVHEEKPRFSWQSASLQRGWFQRSYRLVVAKSVNDLLNEEYLWDSGCVECSTSWEIAYDGPALESVTRYYWRVKVWGVEGDESAWSDLASFTTGLLNAADWKASWIGLESPYPNKNKDEDRRLPAFYLRREFNTTIPLSEARLVICGLGYFQAEINGHQVGKDELVPDLTDYRKRAIYYSYDVTELLNHGENAIGVTLGNGRFFAPRQGGAEAVVSFGLPRLICQLYIRDNSGNECLLISDESWRVTDKGPIRENNDYDGEVYDARMRLEGWSSSGYDDSDWHQAELVDAPGGQLIGNRSQPQRITQQLKPLSVIQPKPNSYVLDMGQNMVGVVEFRLRGRPGQKVSMRFAENVMEDGSIDLANIRSAKVTDTYIFHDFKEIVWRPRFTYHGFRYVEVTGLETVPNPNRFTGCVIHSDLEEGGHFSCSNHLLSRLYRNTLWGIRGNLRSIPTDCPQRDERQGWLGDIANESKGESYDFHAAPFYEKWLDDIQDSQREDGALSDVAPAYWPLYTDNATWPAAYVLAIQWMYQHGGNHRVMERHYPSISSWLQRLYSFTENGILHRDQYGDWCVPPADPKQIHSTDPEQITSKGVLGTSYLYRLCCIMSEFAQVLEKENESQKWQCIADELRENFLREYWDDEKGCIDNGTQTSCILPLFFGLVEGKQKKRLLDYLIHHITVTSHHHVNTGIIGLQWLMRLLSLNGYGDLAFKLATQRDYPSWGYMIENDATTIWELWNGNTASPEMNSGNHLMLIGDFHLWLYEHVAGIRPDIHVQAFQRFHLRPDFLKGIQWAAGKIDTPCGIISSHWRHSVDQVIWKVHIPENASGLAWIPASSLEGILLDGKQVTLEQVDTLEENQQCIYRLNLGSGNYLIQFPGLN